MCKPSTENQDKTHEKRRQKDRLQATARAGLWSSGEQGHCHHGCIQFVKGDRPWWAWAVEKVEKVTGKGLES